MAFIIIKPKRDSAFQRKHPWVFSGAVAKKKGSPAAGETVDIVNSRGGWMGRGAYSPKSQIAVRVWTFDEEERIDPAFFRRRLERAILSRHELKKRLHLSACRLVNAESDGLPGLIIDQYEGFLVCQFLTVGVHTWKDVIVQQLQELVAPEGIFERSESPVLDKEGLPRTVGCLAGHEPPETITIREGDYRFLVDVRNGHKTGFYLDQRDNRHHVTPYATDSDVLNCFCYTGGFGVPAMAAGARTLTNIDVSASALDLARQNIALNNLDSERVDYLQADVFKQLRSFRDAAREFDVIILDPPKFADSKQQLDHACRGYKDINLLAVKLLRAGGYLFTFSCSGLMEPALFQKIVADAALDAGRDAQIIGRMGQAEDHPTSLAFPEGHYLKGLLCRVW
jgi:23S rRNA (cytosine1962-C5)-methyltransferase